MELALASAIGVLSAIGIYLLLRARTFDVILGMTAGRAAPSRLRITRNTLRMPCSRTSSPSRTSSTRR